MRKLLKLDAALLREWWSTVRLAFENLGTAHTVIWLPVGLTEAGS